MFVLLLWLGASSTYSITVASCFQQTLHVFATVFATVCYAPLISYVPTASTVYPSLATPARRSFAPLSEWLCFDATVMDEGAVQIYTVTLGRKAPQGTQCTAHTCCERPILCRRSGSAARSCPLRQRQRQRRDTPKACSSYSGHGRQKLPSLALSSSISRVLVCAAKFQSRQRHHDFVHELPGPPRRGSCVCPRRKALQQPSWRFSVSPCVLFPSITREQPISQRGCLAQLNQA